MPITKTSKKELIMKNIVLLSFFLASCTAKEMKITEDIIEGEVQTVEQVMKDLSATDPLQGKKRPTVEITVPVKKF